jgi:methionine-rich copper-binding protein CopC
MSRPIPGALAPAVVLGLAWVLAAGTARPALAHAELRASEPPEGAVLSAPPGRIALSFTEPMQVTSLRLLDEAGRERPLRREGPRTAATAEARADVPGPLPPGAYRIEYRGLSADGHVGGGAVRFRLEGGAR